ncbi:MAG: AMP-binding protein [candidate division WOR-3 bacterium]
MKWKFVKEPEEIVTLPQMFLKTVMSYPENAAIKLVGEGGNLKEWSYEELYNLIISLAIQMKTKKIKKGDRVAIYGYYSPEWVITYFAIQFIGAIGVPIDNRLTYREAHYLVNDSGAKILFYSPDLLADELVVEKREKYLPLELPNFTSEVKDFPLPPLSLDDPAVILYTSGTTGSPKGVVLTHRNLASNVEMLREVVEFNPNDSFYVLLPLNHIFSQTVNMLAPFSTGSSMILARSLKSKDIIEDCKKTKPTIFAVVPLILEKFIEGIEKEIKRSHLAKRAIFKALDGVGTFLHRIKRGSGGFLYSTIKKNLGLERLKYLISGGAALPKWVSQKFEQWSFPIIQGYGLTETSPVISVNPIYAPKNESVGLPLPGLEIKILNPNENGVGEIAVKGPSVFKGFWENEEATKEVFEGEWFKTGDLGFLDSEGYLYITGRKKSVIVTKGGKNIYPEEIENYLSQSPLIEEVLVLSKPNPKTGSEELVAIVYPNYEELDEYCRKHRIEEKDPHKIINEEIKKLNQDLTDFKRIRRVLIRDEEFPKTPTRKIKRYLFEEEGVEIQ